jgi:hypothetical protein
LSRLLNSQSFNPCSNAAVAVVVVVAVAVAAAALLRLLLRGTNPSDI